MKTLLLFLALSASALAGSFQATLEWDQHPTAAKIAIYTASGVKLAEVGGQATQVTLTLSDEAPTVVYATAVSISGKESIPTPNLTIDLNDPAPEALTGFRVKVIVEIK